MLSEGPRWDAPRGELLWVDIVGSRLHRARLGADGLLDEVAPDGLTVDDEGGIWVALWGGGALRRYSPERALLATVPVLVDRPTSCAFGGPDRATLFITTARHGLDESALARQPDAGRVFRVDGLGVGGAPCAPYRGRTEPLQGSP